MDCRRQAPWCRRASTSLGGLGDTAQMTLLPHSSPSSSSVSLCTTTLVTDMSGCCSLASLMAWASACGVRRQCGEQRIFFRVAMHEHAHHLRSSLQQKATYSLLYHYKKIWNGLPVHFRESISFPQISHFSHPFPDNNSWRRNTLVLNSTQPGRDSMRHGENRSSLISEFSSITWHWCRDCKDHIKACGMDWRNGIKPAVYTPVILVVIQLPYPPTHPYTRPSAGPGSAHLFPLRLSVIAWGMLQEKYINFQDTEWLKLQATMTTISKS